jgi:hypothetical protein
MKDGLCFSCSKGKAATIVGGPTSKFLTATILNSLGGPREEIQPNDSLSVVGDKRRHELMEQELARFPAEDIQSDTEPNENDPNKRASSSTALVTQATTYGKHVLVVSHLDTDAIK